MTVRRSLDNRFDFPVTSVARAVRAVLTRNPPYIDTAEIKTDILFEANVQPSWWLLGTDMRIELEPQSGGTYVMACTTSQWFLLGDIFDYYNGYLRDFFKELRTELRE